MLCLPISRLVRANGNKYGFAVPLALQKTLGSRLQPRLFPYTDDEDGFAIVVNMVFARRKWGKALYAPPISHVARGASETTSA